MKEPTAAEAAEAAKGLTFEIVWAALMESRRQMDEWRAEMQEDARKREEEDARRRAEYEESTRKRDEEAQKREEEYARKRAEYEAEARKRDEEARKRDEEMQKRAEESRLNLEKAMAETRRQLGGIGNTIGELTESMFYGDLWEKFAEYGIPVTSQSVRRTFRDENKTLIAEADVYIENGEYTIPVEVKTKLTEKDVDEHIERIEVIRKYLDARGDKRKLLGAVAGGIVNEKVLKYAQAKGMFVLVQSGDSVTIADTPKGFKAREW